MKYSKLICLFLLLSITGSLTAGNGAKLYNEFHDSGQIYYDQRWQDYVDAIGQRLLKYAKDKDRTYYFFVLDVDTINAFATADGYIFIHRGLIAYLNSEDQLAAVIGHEIGHVARRHHAKRATASLLGQTAGYVAYLVTGRGESWEAVDAVTQMWISGYGREDELEADQFGAELLARAGYNPMAVIETISVLKDQELFAKSVQQQTPSYHGLFATHPKNDKRLQEVVKYAQDSLPETTVDPVGDFWELMDGLHWGRPTTTGTQNDHIYYNKSWRLVIEFPIGWRVSEIQSQVYGTARGGSNVGWVRITRVTRADQIEPADYVRDVIKLDEDEIVSETEVSISCCDYYLVERSHTDPKVTGSYLAVYRRLGNEYYILEAVSGDKGSPENLKSYIEDVISGIRTLTQADLKYENIQKVHLQVAEPGDTYAKLARDSSLTALDYPEETLRLINGHHPNGEPRAGDYVKVIKLK